MKKRTLLFSVTVKDCLFKPFKAPGKGGQKKNKTESAIRCTHIASGAVGECSDYREQSKNKKVAFQKMAESTKFKVWHELKCDTGLGKVEVEERNKKGIVEKRKLRMEEV